MCIGFQKMSLTTRKTTTLSKLRQVLSRQQFPPLERSSNSKQIHAVQDIFGDGCLYSAQEPIFDNSLFCLGFTNRSGSNLLGAYLRDCQPFAGFREDLNPGTIQSHSDRLETRTLPDTLRALTDEQRRKRPIYGFKASVEQVIMLQAFNIPRMYRGGMRLIEIRRDDIVGQAISYHIALQTGRWTSRTRTDRDVEPVCDPQQIKKLVDAIRASQTLMDLVVERHQIPRLIVHYENLVGQPDDQLQKIARFCGYDPEGWSAKSPKLERQADATNLAFRQAFAHHLESIL
jgi:LPS sulfotransferase NodH